MTDLLRAILQADYIDIRHAEEERETYLLIIDGMVDLTKDEKVELERLLDEMDRRNG